jgi:RimJ/RimL family protein N-acetyltransferase
MSLPMLQTARLLLRPLQEDDAEGLHTAYGDADAMRFLGLPAYRDAPPPSACRVDPWGPAHLPCAVSRRISSIILSGNRQKSFVGAAVAVSFAANPCSDP